MLLLIYLLLTHIRCVRGVGIIITCQRCDVKQGFNLVAWVVNGDDTLVSVGNFGEGLLGEVNLVVGTGRALVYKAHVDGLAARASRAETRNLACLTTRGTVIIEAIICSDNEIVRQEVASVVAVACRCYM